MTQHRAIVRHNRHCTVDYRDTPEPGVGELLIAPEKVALCGTDIQILRGDRNDPSRIVGHEGVARILATGPGVTDHHPGDRVTVNPTHPQDPTFLLGHNVEGLFLERVIIGASAVSGGLVSTVDPQLPSARATLIEPYAAVRYALACLSQTTPDTLVIFGDGLIGNLAAAIAPVALYPATTVIVVHREQIGSQWTSRFAPHTINVQSAAEAARNIGGRVAVLTATHRRGTVASIDAAITHFGHALTAIHPIGGVEPAARTPLLPGIDIDGVRHAGTGGPWPPVTATFTSGPMSVALSGNRGVTSTQLDAAATTLASESGQLDALLTHEVGLETGAAYINKMIACRTRVLDDELVVRLVIDVRK